MSNKKEEFVHRLAGTFNWKEYALRLDNLLVSAELREKSFVHESRYFYDSRKQLENELGLTDEEKEFLYGEYMKWLDENDPFNIADTAV